MMHGRVATLAVALDAAGSCVVMAMSKTVPPKRFRRIRFELEG